MTTKKLLLAAVAATSLGFSGNLAAQEFRIEIGDRPYYTHGARYWADDYEMIWVQGHWSEHHHHWVHGHYVRGEHHRHNWQRHHQDENYDHNH